MARRLFTFGMTAAAMLLAYGAQAQDGSCKPVFDAITRNGEKRPTTSTSSSRAPTRTRKARSTEIIFTGRKTYLRVDGQWQTSKTTAEQTLKLDEENRKNSNATCRLLRDESVDGVSAGVYSLHSESDVGNSDGQLWVSKATGMPLRQTIDVMTDPASGKTHVETALCLFGYRGAGGHQVDRRINLAGAPAFAVSESTKRSPTGEINEKTPAGFRRRGFSFPSKSRAWQ